MEKEENLIPAYSRSGNNSHTVGHSNPAQRIPAAPPLTSQQEANRRAWDTADDQPTPSARRADVVEVRAPVLHDNTFPPDTTPIIDEKTVAILTNMFGRHQALQILGDQLKKIQERDYMRVAHLSAVEHAQGIPRSLDPVDDINRLRERSIERETINKLEDMTNTFYCKVSCECGKKTYMRLEPCTKQEYDDDSAE